MQIQRAVPLGLLFWFFLAGCQTEIEPSVDAPTLVPALEQAAVVPTLPATETAPAMLSPTPATLSPTPSNTPPPVPMPTSTPTVLPTDTPAAIPSDTPAATLSPALVSGFRQDASFPGVVVERLWVAPEGALWALGAAGSYALTEESWAPLWPGDVAPLDSDTSGRVWAWLDGEETLATYDAVDGWQSLGPGQPEGLEPVGDPVTGFAVDPLGYAWVARGRDGLWQFDPASATWTIWRANDVGFSPPPVSEDAFAAYAPTLYFTDVAVDGLGGVWVAACPMLIYEDGPIPWQLRDGEGARRQYGEAWIGIDMAFERCIWDIAVDAEERVWLAGPPNDLWSGEPDLLRYGAEAGWESLPVPANEGLFGDRPRFASQVRFDGAGMPWIWVETRGGASFPAPALYMWFNENWVTVMDEFRGTVAFGPEGNAWLFGEEAYLTQAGVLNRELLWYRQMLGEIVPVDADRIKPETMVVDGEDRVWFVGADGRSLWTVAHNP